ncbi:MAG TPA: NAD(P)/FAD-dependent oxidoreductase [Polyangiaceae bacterium]
MKEREPVARAPSGIPDIPEARTPGRTIAIIGAGIAGLCMGIRLKRAGIESFTIYEKASKVGGTWRENRYPGSGCDVPSHLYSFSFEPNPDFSRVYSPQPEIERYLDHCADKYGILPHVRFDTEIASAVFHEESNTWKIRTTAGEEIRADILVTGTGQLNRPSVPSFPGLAEFRGTAFHSALYRSDHDLAGRRVAVIGNGASAIQLVPRIANQAARLLVFQRTPNWLLPRNDRVYGPRARSVLRRLPSLLYLYRALIFFLCEGRFFVLRDTGVRARMQEVSKQFMESQVREPVLRAQLTPTYPMGCKRILISDDYYPTLERPNVELITDAIERFSPEGVVTAGGREHPVDTVIFATGFESTSFLAPMEIRGRGGRRLSEAWVDGAEAYLGIAVAGFPNLFLLYGPNTNLGHNSIIFMIECQVDYVLKCLELLEPHGERAAGATLEVRPEAMRLYNEQLQRDLQETAWGEGCTSWYKTAAGKVTNNWSGFTVQYWWKTRRPDFSAFELRRPPA